MTIKIFNFNFGGIMFLKMVPFELNQFPTTKFLYIRVTKKNSVLSQYSASIKRVPSNTVQNSR